MSVNLWHTETFVSNKSVHALDEFTLGILYSTDQVLAVNSPGGEVSDSLVSIHYLHSRPRSGQMLSDGLLPSITPAVELPPPITR